ncbi:MAG: DUF397 domain-containing protein [Pseudonocardia sp.]
MAPTDRARAEEPPTRGPGWRHSSFSQGADQTCVDVAFAGPAVMVRDSKDPQGPRLRFSPDEWHVFLQGVREGEFDLPSSSQLPSA